MSKGSAATRFPASESNTPWWQRTWFLALLLFAAVLLNNSELIFNTRLYEADDFAANSLQVLKAKHFNETLGNYCRFGFHHPGPAFFYLFGWGEIVSHDVLPFVPTPFNGQLIALYALSAFFFGATIALIAAKLSRAAAGWFVGVSLLFAAWHFGAASKFFEFIPGYLGFLTPWPPCFIVVTFLCFVVAAGSVAAGYGKDLPLMTLAGCFLVHGHVAMPLFVVPLALFAYGALWREIRCAGGQPWNLFRRQHWLAAATIALFLAPIVTDLLISEPNNLTRIVRHLRTSYGEGKGILQSLCYFLHFGAYAGAASDQPIPAFEAHDAATLRSFFLLHWRPYAWWLGSILVFIVTTRRTQPDLPGTPKFLNFDSEANGEAERVALFLERRRIAWWVREDWPLVFGEERIVRPGKTNQSVLTLSSSFWRIALRSNPAKTGGDPNATVLPLTSEFDLVVHRGK